MFEMHHGSCSLTGLAASTRVFLCISICVVPVLRLRQSSFTCSCKSLRRYAMRRFDVSRTNTQLLMGCCCWLDVENDGTKLPLWLCLCWFGFPLWWTEWRFIDYTSLTDEETRLTSPPLRDRQLYTNSSLHVDKSSSTEYIQIKCHVLKSAVNESTQLNKTALNKVHADFTSRQKIEHEEE